MIKTAKSSSDEEGETENFDDIDISNIGKSIIGHGKLNGMSYTVDSSTSNGCLKSYDDSDTIASCDTPQKDSQSKYNCIYILVHIIDIPRYMYTR